MATWRRRESWTIAAFVFLFDLFVVVFFFSLWFVLLISLFFFFFLFFFPFGLFAFAFVFMHTKNAISKKRNIVLCEINVYIARLFLSKQKER